MNQDIISSLCEPNTSFHEQQPATYSTVSLFIIEKSELTERVCEK